MREEGESSFYNMAVTMFRMPIMFRGFMRWRGEIGDAIYSKK